MPSPFEFVIHRPLSTIIYTYWVAAMPFLLLASVILFYTFGKGKDEKKAPAFYEVAFGVAATVVAILPLRIVLVPSSLPSLTRLDLVFSTGVTLLVGLSVAYISVGAAKRKPDDPDNQPGVTG
jgi:sorbitol-specific phosphotransferase system component IIC